MVEDLGAELVTEDSVGAGVEAVVAAARAAAELDHMLHVVQGMQVGAADAAGQRLHQHLAGRRLQLGDLVADQLLVAPNHRPHRTLPGSWPPCRGFPYSVTLARRNR